MSRLSRKFLSDHPDLIITRADKGNTTVAMDRGTYLNKMNDLLTDSNTYVIIKKNPVNKIISNLRELLARWRRKEFISTGVARSLLLSDGVLPRAYGLPKIHKANCPLRIIISSINSPLHFFASYLHKILYNNIPKPNSHISNSFELVNKLKNFYVDEHLNLISLDVINLFTNVSHDLIVGGIAKRWHFLKSKTKIPYNEFLIALKLILDSTFSLLIMLLTNRFLARLWDPRSHLY